MASAHDDVPVAAAAAHNGGRRHFAAHRRLAANRAFRPFLGRSWWHRHHHLGWVGPLFWPYGYGDVFYSALWPSAYDEYDPFWAYGYGDIYAGIFSPYNYSGYVEGTGAPTRMKSLTHGVAQSCADEAAEVTGWPVDQIQDAVAPNAQQSALLDAFGNAIVKASDVIRAHCPTDVSFTPTGRIADMQERLDGLVQAVNIIEPPLGKFYDSLSDEQKARFNDIGMAHRGKSPGKSAGKSSDKAAAAPGDCGATAISMSWPGDRIDQVIRPTDAQKRKLDDLQTAAAKAADLMKAACPSEVAATPPARLAQIGKRLAAMLEAVKTIRPPLDAFYGSLSDDQKARFNSLGRQLFAANKK
jgi:hypothetical protein